MKNWLLHTYMNTNEEEIKLLEEVKQRCEKRENLPNDDTLLSLLRVYLFESELGYRDNRDKFKKLYTSLKKRNLLEIVEKNGSYFKITDKGKEFLVEFAEFSRLPWWAQFSKFVMRYFLGIFSVLSLIISIIALIVSIFKPSI